MLVYSDFVGAIFDVDDTLLDNKPHDLARSLHGRSRLAAIHEVGRRHGIVALQEIGQEENGDSFRTAKVHSLEGALWNLMHQRGLVDTDVIDPDNELLKEMAQLKDDLHEIILRTEGEPLPDAVAFVRALASNGFAGKLAIASTAIRRDIDIFLEMTNLSPLFPDKHIIAKDRVTQLKPHPEGFEKAFKTLGLPAKAKRKVLAFEDDPRGLEAAHRAGLYTCAITSRFSKDEWGKTDIVPDLVADSYAEFADLLNMPL